MPPKRKSDASLSAEPRRSGRESNKPALLLDETSNKPATPESSKKAKTAAAVKQTASSTVKKENKTSASAKKSKASAKKEPLKKASKEEAVSPDEGKADAEASTEKPNGQSEDDKKDEVSSSGKVKVGDALPDVTLKNEEDKEVNLASIARDSGVVIFSYPAASTPGCTSQACSYRDQYADITDKGFQIYGLSTDTVKAQEKFKRTQNLQFPLLSDPQKKLLGPLGGTASKKTARRCHWVVQMGGKLVSIELDVKPKDCVARVLKTLSSL